MQTPSRKRTHNPQNSHSHGQQCVCQICTCGKHSCPEPQEPFNADSSYHKDYQPYKIGYQPPIKTTYTPQQGKYDPRTMKSTYETAYKPNQIHLEEPIRPTRDYIPTRGKFEDQTEYRKNYIPSKLQAQKVMTPQSYVPNKVKFEGHTTYKSQFSPKAMQKRGNLKPEAYKPKNMPFQGKSTYEREFQPHKMEVQRPSTNVEPYRGGQSRFQGESRYAEDYKKYEIAKRNGCAVEELPSRPMRCSPGKQHLHFSPQKNVWE